MEIRILQPEEQAAIYADVLEMLVEADGDFVPPLSSRSSSTQKELTATATRTTGVQEYFEQLKTQRFGAVFEDGRLLAFVSYRENYTCEEIPASELPNIYLTTLIVCPEARGRGVTTALYGQLFARYSDVNIFTRTWSANAAHIKVLGKYGFTRIKTLKDHRGPGMDTVYFKRPRK